VLEYAVDLLKIEHIIVCGHYGCSGVQAAMEDHYLGLVDNWLRNIRDVYARHRQELEAIIDHQERSNRLVELNVIQQVLNVCHTTIVQGAWERKQKVSVHGWVYDMASGGLKDLDCCLSNITQVESIYRVRLSK
jgi:carbonic anhydrase